MDEFNSAGENASTKGSLTAPCTDFFLSCETCKSVKSTKGTDQLFLKAVSVWINKPHVVNRRLCGSKILAVKRSDSKNEIDEALIDLTKKYKSTEKGSYADVDTTFKDLSEETSSYTLLIREIIPKMTAFCTILEAILFEKAKVSVGFIPLERERLETSKELKNTSELLYVVNFTESEAVSTSSSNEINIAWSCDHASVGSDVQRQLSSLWLQTVLLEKLVVWSQISDISTSHSSLKLVPVDKYRDVYVRLKNMYGKDLVKNWTESTDPKKFVYEDIAIAAYLLLIWEEDRELKGLTEKQTFVDLGCGNGLLVYILTKEGHQGLGIDLRKRKIWDTFGPGIDLEEKAITPSAEHLFPNFDWIIGNHSDELTPWIPVITARSSYNCCFFLLPCCFHDFTGKYGHVERGMSHYGSYLEYVKEIIHTCGFLPGGDTLRIPSTKRICYIGRQRSYPEELETGIDKERQAFIDKRTAYIALLSNMRTKRAQPYVGTSFLPSGGPLKMFHKQPDAVANSNKTSNTDTSHVSSSHNKRKASDSPQQSSEKTCDSTNGQDAKTKSKEEHIAKGLKKSKASTCETPKVNLKDRSHSSMSDDGEPEKWAAQFKPRVEGGVRNCQLVSKSTKDKIVSTVFNKVMESDSPVVASLDSGRSWRKGGVIPLGDLVELFDKSTLQELKSECGGLQTLLRNHSHIFQVTGGMVRLRDLSVSDPWEGRDPKKGNNKGQKLKTTLCWFFDHHPDGCPRLTDQCTFAHGVTDLRSKDQT